MFTLAGKLGSSAGKLGSSAGKLGSSAVPKSVECNFGEEINMDFFKKTIEGQPSLYGQYYLTSCLDGEASRCNLYGKSSFIYYIISAIKTFLKTLGYMVLFNLPLLGSWIFLIIIFSVLFLPIIKAVWSAISLFMCFLVDDFGIPTISLPGWIPLAGGAKIFDGWYPFKTMIFFFFGDVFDCASGPDWANIKYGKCDERFGGGNASKTKCNTEFATDYSLFKDDSDTVCTYLGDCPDAPQSYVLSDSMISGFSPVINTVNRKGTAPFKYLKCCDIGKDQVCSEKTQEQAKKSINYANKFPRGYITPQGQDSPILDERKFLWGGQNEEDELGKFKPVTMLEATDRNFEKNKVWYGVNQIQLGAPTEPHSCTISIANPLYHWLDVYVLELREYIKYLLWMTIIIFVMYEIYNTIYHIWQGNKFIKNIKNDEKKIKNYVRGYLCTQNVNISISDKKDCNNRGHNDGIETAVDNFMTHWKNNKGNEVNESKYSLNGTILDVFRTETTIPRKPSQPGTSGSTGSTGSTESTGSTGSTGSTESTGSTGSTGLDDKQTIVFGFIMVITFIILGLVSITTILKKRNKKNKVEITNWPI